MTAKNILIIDHYDELSKIKNINKKNFDIYLISNSYPNSFDEKINFFDTNLSISQKKIILKNVENVKNFFFRDRHNYDKLQQSLLRSLYIELIIIYIFSKKLEFFLKNVSLKKKFFLLKKKLFKYFFKKILRA